MHHCGQQAEKVFMHSLTSNKSCNSHQEIIKIHILTKTDGNANVLNCLKGIHMRD